MYGEFLQNVKASNENACQKLKNLLSYGEFGTVSLEFWLFKLNILDAEENCSGDYKNIKKKLLTSV